MSKISTETATRMIKQLIAIMTNTSLTTCSKREVGYIPNANSNRQCAQLHACSSSVSAEASDAGADSSSAEGEEDDGSEKFITQE